MFKNIIFSILIFVIGAYFTNYYKNKSKDLELLIEQKKEVIFELKRSNEIELKENVYLKSPENIKKLAKKHLENDYIFFDQNNIKILKINEK